MKRILIILICLLIPLMSGAETLPRLEISCPRLNYFEKRDGTLLINGEAVSMTLKYRGSSSAFNEGKRNYSIHLKTSDGEQYKRALFGMRKDDDWILDGTQSDLSRIRNRICMDLWDAIYILPWCEKSGAVHGCYTELFFNGTYKGLYALNERLDRKQLQLDKNGGRLYSVSNPEKNGVNVLSLGEELPPPADRNSTDWYNLELRYGGLSENPWQEIYDLLQFFHEADGQTFAAGIGTRIDMNNWADYFLFANVLALNDNMCKNMWFCVGNAEESSRILLIPWDMDAGLGRLYSGEEIADRELRTNDLFDRLLKVPAFSDLLRSRWTELRKTFFTPAFFRELMDRYIAAFEESGVIGREESKHPVFRSAITGMEYRLDLRTEWNRMRLFFEERLAFMDEVLMSESL